MTWRDIIAGDVNWRGILPEKTLRRTSVILQTCLQSPHANEGEWSRNTLGEICDMGVREWQRIPGWGEAATEIFKAALRRIAKDPSIATARIATDAFDPERD
jgi:hypothetical protein